MIPSRIIVHHSLTADGQTVSWGAIRRYHVEVRGWADIGYHVGVELVGDRYEALIGRPPNLTGAHCAGQNLDSLGICMVGNFDLAPPPEAQLELAVRLVRGLLEILRLPKYAVRRHSDHAPGKSCPGRRFPWKEFLERI